ncbi:MAG TPA: ABC transporter ATP-binding protein [Streptosporangiaceae bacterium]|nr:ABC transporter ATP-binding protein [Streptosporangiaceae bacterium]
MAPVLDIQNLSTHIKLTSSVVQAVGNVDLHIEAGETLGVVGESGCGKSITGLSIMGLLPPGGSIVNGSVKLNDRELVGLKDEELRRIRGNDIAMIFQDPLTSLDPTKTIGYQVGEPVRLHRNASKAEALDRAVEVLNLVGLPRPKERLKDYPHQLSGGLRQRVMIAMALACEPKLLIADEPTTALDVTIQAQILALLRDLKERLGMAMLLITHDMGVIAGHADRVNVMYAGRVVETAEAVNLFDEMHHPYTQALLASIPQLDQDMNKALHAIPGLPPDLAHLPEGCRFAARCTRATDKCRADEPPLSGTTFEHKFACWHPVDGPLALALIGHEGPDAASTGLVGSDAESLDEAAAGDKVGFVHDAQLADSGAAGAAEADGAAGEASSSPETAAGAGGPVVVAAGLVETPDGRLEVAELPVEAVANSNGVAPLLELRNLVKEFPVTSGAILQRRVAAVHAVSDVSFSVPAGTTFGLVGESGCGKTTIGKLIVALEKPSSGSISVNGEDVSKLHRSDLRRKRRDLQLMFQDPQSSLDPRMRVGTIIAEPLAVQHLGSKRAQRDRVFELLSEVGLPRNAVERYPHEFSGGQRQRIGLARALTVNPRLIVADEPVSALDVSIRAQVLNLMKRLQATYGLTYVVISHDLAVVKYMADQIGVMYLGKLVEMGSGEDIYERPAHPYTAGLIATIPVPNPTLERAKHGAAIKGELPSPVNPPSGCRFRTRCQFAQERCAVEEPKLRSFGPDHVAACHFPLQSPHGADADAPAMTSTGDSSQ